MKKADFGDQLSGEERGRLDRLLERYQTVFSDTPGLTKLAEHRIPTVENNAVRLPPYRLPHAYRELVRKELDEMLQSGIIETSRSDWASPIVLVKKKDGALRMCVDYRRLNTVSRVEAYPMPRIDDLIDGLGKAKYITTLDLTKGYWQMPVAKADRYKTAFITPFGLFQFRVLPFGLSGAPASFQRLMDNLVRGCEGYAAAYLDDLVIYSNTFEQHLEHLAEVFKNIGEAGLTVKVGKCQFAMSRCVYLGHIVGSGSVQPPGWKISR